MIEKEKQLPEGERMDFVSIVTPNHMHFPPAKMALENGFHVLSDKPATFDLKESKTLEKLVKQSKCLYGLTHNYTGYPLVKEARDMIAAGKLGKIRKVVGSIRRAGWPRGWRPVVRSRPTGARIPSAAAPPVALVISVRMRRISPSISLD